MRISDWSSDVCSSDLPRVVELEWGDETHPRVAIVGKGVCFDSGGLDIKPSSAMLLMKKDMGGAAHALALARLVMAANLRSEERRAGQGCVSKCRYRSSTYI